MLKEFKSFAMRGNVMDLAVGVILGAAFGKIVSSLVADVIMPLVGLLVGGIDFSGLSFTFGKAEVKYGIFIQTVVDFVIISFSIFLFVKLFNKLYTKEKKEEEALPSLTKEEELLTEIRDLLKSGRQ
ncbi:large conductance mechanosensitive channel protein MscL [Domibacillus sp. DTU_2020_1001157_1_SI_ALB_TIR_016]|uniref:large conductance mechanosensitive channel protein MscL n=1 Tax=unclassified Domibacillus TaxID=2632383 RepID=UPI001F5733D5|nr:MULTISPECIES: large conductance mechanosensitive channel protein MscL [unclassified Domibacillus]MCI2254043.1 large conductance mechanosensitive channel protein MscL [Domibacillus sp. PGB-M46]WNS79337.1 large conductance mechanosensitive channel protein MscL [Domibacillus sp. DTU_2020_1001157_1_SI_ALB_TIR_016]